MERIDFMGVPGSGKTATYRELKKAFQKKDFLFAEEAKERALINYAAKIFISEKDIRNLINYLVIHNNFFAMISRERIRLFNSRKGRFYRRFAYENPEFTLSCSETMKHYQQDDLPANVRFFIGATVFLEKVAEAQLMKEHLNKPFKVFFDESLSHKIYEIVNFDTSPITDVHRNDIKDIFNSIPMPSLAINFNEDKTLIMKRLNERPRLRQKEILQRSKRRVEEWVEDAIVMNELSIKTLQKRGTNILQLPQGINAMSKVAIIIDYIEKNFI